MTRTQSIIKLLILFIGVISTTCHAENQSVKSIEQFAIKYLSEKIPEVPNVKVNIKISQLDPRLKLEKCGENKMEGFLPHGQSPLQVSTVGVRCTGPKPWKLFVPVNLTITTKVVVNQRPLTRGAMLTEKDLSLVEVSVNKLQQGYFQDPKALIGLIVTQPLGPSMVIGPNHIRVPNVVKRGDPVSISAKIEGIAVSAKGVALMNGTMGETIKVRSTTSPKIIEAKVTGKQQVEVIL